MAVKNTEIIELKDIKKLLQIISGNWHIILICMFLSTILAYLYSYRLPEIYAAKTQLLLKSNETYPIQQDILRSLYGPAYYGFEKMANEKRIITSTDLVAQVVSKLKLDVSYFIVGRIQTKEVYAGTPFRIEAEIYSPSYYEFPFLFKIVNKDIYEITYDVKGQNVILRQKFGEPLIKKDFYFLVQKTDAINASTLSSLKEITYQFVVHDRRNLVYNYKSALDVRDLEYTAIMEVTMEDEIPERAVIFLDTLAKVYMFNSLKSKIKINENTVSYIDRQLNEVTDILDSIEDIMETYKDKKEILNISKEEETYFKNLSDFELQKRKLELQLQSLDYLKNYIVSNLNRELLPPALYMNEEDVYLKQAITELYNLQVKINSSLFSSTEKSTSVKEIEYRIELLRGDILKYIVNTTNAINEKIKSIEGEISYYTGLLKGVPRNQRALLNINRKLQVNEKMYLYLLEKRAETVIARAGIVPEISIVESAHSAGIVKPDKKKIYYTFISAGILLALAVGFLRFLFFAKIENLDELREITQLPVLGEVIHAVEAKNTYLITDTFTRSFVTESFRHIRTNLEYLAPNEGTSNAAKGKTILIISNHPRMGKTFCSVNLGAILAKGGKKVLLAEMDLHKPKLHSALNIVPTEKGMSTFLAGKNSPEDIIVKYQIENLDVIPAGHTPPNPSELIMSANLLKLFDYARKNYDYMIIDTPPAGMISDALMIMKYTDVNLFILNAKHKPKEGVRYATNLILDNKIKGLALVLNNVKVKHARYYYKKYKYDYTSYLSADKKV